MTAAIEAGDRLTATLDDGLARLGIDVPPEAPASLMAFLRLLERWNATYNLTAVRDPRDMLVVHLLDSLSILPLLDHFDPASILDVGSGAGLPGIPLAICRPGWQIATVDAVAKKIGFQRQVKGALRLPNLSPHHARVETLSLDPLPEVIVTRAYSAIDATLASIDRLTAAGSTLVAMKGAVPADEIQAVRAPWAVVEVRPLDVPFLGAQRCAVVLRRS